MHAGNVWCAYSAEVTVLHRASLLRSVPCTSSLLDTFLCFCHLVHIVLPNPTAKHVLHTPNCQQHTAAVQPFKACEDHHERALHWHTQSHTLSIELLTLLEPSGSPSKLTQLRLILCFLRIIGKALPASTVSDGSCEGHGRAGELWRVLSLRCSLSVQLTTCSVYFFVMVLHAKSWTRGLAPKSSATHIPRQVSYNVAISP